MSGEYKSIHHINFYDQQSKTSDPMDSKVDQVSHSPDAFTIRNDHVKHQFCISCSLENLKWIESYSRLKFRRVNQREKSENDLRRPFIFSFRCSLSLVRQMQ